MTGPGLIQRLIQRWTMPLAGVLAAGFLVFDLSLPLGVAAGVPYVAVVLLGWWHRDPRTIYRLAGLSSALIVTGFFFSPEGAEQWVVFTNRLLALLTIWLTAGLLAMAKHSEVALRDSEAALAEAQRLAKIGNWRWSVADKKVISCSAELARIYGIGLDEVDAHLNPEHRLAQVIYPEDRLRVEQAFERFDEEGCAYEIDYRIVCPDGEIRHVLETGEAVRGSAGRAAEQIGTLQDITAIERAEKALRENESLLRHAAEMARLGYWVWDEVENKCIHCSETLARINEVTVEQYLARYDTLDALIEMIHPDDQARYRKIVDDSVNAVEHYEVEYRWVSPSGDIQYFRERGEPVLDMSGKLVRTVGTLQDITAYKLGEEALRASEARAKAAEQRLLDAIESISEGFVLYDDDDRLVLSNRKWMELYGYSESRVYPGVRYEDLVRLDVELGAVKVGGEGEDEDYIGRRIGYRRTFEGAFDVQLTDGRWVTIRERETSDGGIVGVQADITERKMAEEAILAAKEEAELASRAKSEFLANMSHELRTPLNAIIGFAEVISKESFGPVGGKYPEYAEDIASSGHHLLELISDILDLSKIESGSAQVRIEKVNLVELVSTCISLMRERVEAGNLHVVSALAEDELHWLHADQRMLKQILINLLSNAVKFTPPGGVITISARTLPDGDYAIAVSDTGIGIAPEHRSTALARFGQVESHYARKYEGTGLGLPLSTSMVELLGGRFDLDSRVGDGTTVTLTFPEKMVANRRKSRKRQAV